MNQVRSALGRSMLPREYFVSEAQYASDLRLMRAHWCCVGRSENAAHQNDFFLADWLGESIIIVRQSNENLHALLNVCRHRGTRICVDANGHFRNVIRCPYHGWCYDLSGNLISAPNMIAQLPNDQLGLIKFQVKEWNGFIFVSEQPQISFETMIDKLTPLTLPWSLVDLRKVACLRYEVAANWKLIVQNYSECYHCPVVHPQLDRLTPYRTAGNHFIEGAVLGGPMLLNDQVESMTMTGALALPRLPQLDDKLSRQICYYSLFPNMLLSLHPDYVMTHRIQPSSFDRSIIECEFFALPAESQDPESLRERLKSAIEFWDLTNRQDWEMCERSQQGIQSHYYQPGPYADLESLLPEFDAYYLRALSRMALST